MIEINLLPHREARRAADLRESVAVLVLGLVLIAGGIVFLNGRADNQLAAARASVSQLESDISHYKPQEKQVIAFKKKKAALEDKLEVIDTLDRARTGPVRVLDELAMSTPERLWLKTLETEGGRIKLSGESMDNGVVADLLRALNASEYFGDVDLVKTGQSSEQNGVTLVEFEINARLIMPVSKKKAENDGKKDA